MELLITALISLATGALVAWLIFRTIIKAHNIEKSALASEIGDLKNERQRLSDSLEAKNEQIRSASAESSVNAERARNLEQQLADLRATADEQIKEAKADNEKNIASLQKRYDEQLETQLKLFRSQITEATEKILSETGKELANENDRQLSAILNPLKSSITDMKDRVEKQEKDHIERISRLDATIQATLKKADDVGLQAERLANALTSENKTQGNFGELQLRTLLEQLGLEEGVQFEEQTTMCDPTGNPIPGTDSGKKMRPDVIIHFPDHRDVIIDSKVSLTDFARYHNAENENDKADALKAHIASVKKHVNELAAKNYAAYGHLGNEAFQMVIMFVFSESALQLALSNDSDLWNEAYNKGILIAGPQSIYMFLKLVQHAWDNNRQLNNQKKIIETAEALMARVQTLYERFNSARDALDKTSKTFDDIDRSLRADGKSITTSARQLVELGVKQDKRHKLIPEKGDDETGA